MSVSEKFQKSQRRWDSFIPLLGGAKDGGKTPWDPQARLLCAPPAPLASAALGSPSRLGRTGQVRPATQGHQAGWCPCGRRKGRDGHRTWVFSFFWIFL